MIKDLAAEGDVIIVGRGSQAVLRDIPTALHVRIIAPLEKRVARLMEQEKLDRHAAIQRIQASDRASAEYLRRYYHVDWADAALYDLVINTGRTPYEAAVQLITTAWKLKREKG